MADEGVQAAIWAGVTTLVADSLGLHFPVERQHDLQRGLQAAAQDFGCEDALSCAARLLAAPLSTRELHRLATHLTIGETYFFRERDSLDALARTVLPQIIARRRGSRRLRIWSAACSTGEEAYTLAIMVRGLLPDWHDWRVTILATDINERFLRRAAEAVYGEWSFRGTDAAFRSTYFTPTADGRFALRPEIRDSVRFTHLNLAEDHYPSLATDTNAMDLILCRNLLIYFTPPQARDLVSRLGRSLVEDGWLVVSPSECSQALFRGFTAVNFPGAILYRRGGTPARVRRETLSPSAMEPAAGHGHGSLYNVAESLYQSGQFAAVADVLAPVASADARPQQHIQDATAEPAAPAEPREFSLLARSLANEGRLLDARACIERWIAADKLDGAARYLQAMVLQELGDNTAARNALLRTVYLQPDFVLAHFALGNLARTDGRSADARRHMHNAQSLLRNLPTQQLLPESDGLTAGRLAEIIDAVAQPGALHV